MLTDEAGRRSDEGELGPNSSKGPGLNPVQTCWHVLGHVSTPGWVSRLGPKRFAGIFDCVLQESRSNILITVSFNVSLMPRECLRVVAELRAFLYLRFYACNCFDIIRIQPVFIYRSFRAYLFQFCEVCMHR